LPRTLTPPQVGYILNDCGARALLVSTPAKFEEVDAVVRECAAIEKVVIFEPDGSSASNALSLAELEGRGRALETEQPKLFAELARGSSPEDLATIIYTSGTTGEPKGVMLTHRNLISNTESVNSLFQSDRTDTVAGVRPLFHSFGFTYTLWFPMLNGASVAYHAQPLDAKGLGALIEKTKATFLPAPPNTDHPRALHVHLDSARYVLAAC